MSIIEISVAELETALSAGARLIDVRETDEYQAGHVAGAVHVALGSVPDRVHAFQGDGTTYVICKVGGRSLRACEFLAQHGVEVVNVAGGMVAWLAGDRPIVSGGQSL